MTTLAGLAGWSGSQDGIGSAARFSDPFGVAVDSGGNVHVADTINCTIRKVTSAGVVTTLAGRTLFDQFGNPRPGGYREGIGNLARFSGPRGVAVDSSGNVFVADDHTIRKVTPAGMVTTLAGLVGQRGSVDGTGSNARFNEPWGVAVDTALNVYVTDAGNATIRRITSAGVVATLAGLAGSVGSADGTGSNARFSYPAGVVVDSAGNVYVADTCNNTIRKVTPTGMVTTLAGGRYGSRDGTSGSSRFNGPSGVAVDSAGTVYVADTFSYTIREFSADGVVTTLAGNLSTRDQSGNPIGGNADGTGSDARFGRTFNDDRLPRRSRQIEAGQRLCSALGQQYHPESDVNKWIGPVGVSRIARQSAELSPVEAET